MQEEGLQLMTGQLEVIRKTLPSQCLFCGKQLITDGENSLMIDDISLCTFEVPPEKEQVRQSMHIH
jgi:hypothetical protein